MATLDLGRTVGDAHPPFVIAAVDAAKLGTIDHAIAAIDVAAASGCDAVKLTSLPWTWCARVYDHADPRGIKLLTTVSDERSIERLDWFGAPAFEIFFDWSDLDLVAAAARTGKPIVLSVANASDADVAEVVQVARGEGARGIALVQRVIDGSRPSLEALRRHQVVVGISDRSTEPGTLRTAILAGARIIEKRLTPKLLGDLPGMVRECQLAWSLLGHPYEWTTS
ncbi:MAG: N-acetylneuraminate synthase family protein [Myxococcales bacterium]|nr:N-acetylneuraminate synthase family protein [Myxococcales bacterium]